MTNERTIVTEDQISAGSDDADPTATIPDDEPDEPEVDTDLDEAHVVTDPLDGQGADEPQDIMPLDADLPPGVEIDEELIEAAVRIGSAAIAWANGWPPSAPATACRSHGSASAWLPGTARQRSPGPTPSTDTPPRHRRQSRCGGPADRAVTVTPRSPSAADTSARPTTRAEDESGESRSPR